MKCYTPGYPRPQFVRKNWENLNGQWDFAFDDKNEGLCNAWNVPENFPKAKKITVPFVYECPASGIGDPSRHDLVWYHRNFTVQKTGGRLFVHFEGCDYKSEVWINGVHAGSHTGGYTRFSFDISHLVKEGENHIAVRAEDSFSLSQPRGKQRWKNENFGCWYIQTTGIWKTVWLEQVNDVYIESVKMTPVLQEGRLDIEAVIAGAEHLGDSFLGELELQAEASFAGKTAGRASVTPNLGGCRFSVSVASLEISEWGIIPWSPENPGLYDICFSLTHKGEKIDEALSYFGMREIRIEGSQILLNGQPLYQKLILDQGYWKDSHLSPPNEQALVEDIDKVMSAGYNGVRKHQKTEDELFLYWADVKGLLVWSEVPATYLFNDEATANFTTEWQDIIRQNYNHPAIITWTPFNESWGIPAVKTSAEQQRFTEAVYYLTKSFDPMRPVICNDGWEHTVSDIITLHDYEEGAEEFLARYGNTASCNGLEKILNNEVFHNGSKTAFADNYRYRGQPVIISEFGGIAFSSGSGWGYGNKVNTKEEYIRRFDAITQAIKSLDGVCGYCYTQVTDVQQEINGIMDIERRFKIDPGILKEINGRKPGGRNR